MLDVLVVAPHPDDAELGAAGAILQFKAEGLRVGVLDLTSGEPTPHGSPEIRARETAEASAVLGLDWRENLGFAESQAGGDARGPAPSWPASFASKSRGGYSPRIGSMRIPITSRRRSLSRRPDFGRS